MNEEIKTENVPVGIVTMLSEQQAKTNHRLAYAISIVAICWLLTVGGFLLFLSEYEITINNYGDLENSKINSSTGQQAENMTNYFNGGKDDNK